MLSIITQLERFSKFLDINFDVEFLKWVHVEIVNFR